MDFTSVEYFNKKWLKVIQGMPSGGDYAFQYRKYGYEIIANFIKQGSKVFDFAAGLGVFSQLIKEKRDCIVAGNDFSNVAMDYAKEITGGDFRTTGEIFGGPYDYVVANYFLEHIADPCKWLDDCFNFAPYVICSIPNNFRKVGEHVDMQWSNWEEFAKVFKKYKWYRIDEGQYYTQLHHAYKHPILVFEKSIIENNIDENINTISEAKTSRKKRTKKVNDEK
jgi:hypothetical protein